MRTGTPSSRACRSRPTAASTWATRPLIARDTGTFGTGNASIDSYYAKSLDHGATFSTPIKVSTHSSDPAVSAQNNLQRQFFGDYNQIVSSADKAWFIYTDTRNGAGCPAVDAYQHFLVDNGLARRGTGGPIAAAPVPPPPSNPARSQPRRWTARPSSATPTPSSAPSAPSGSGRTSPAPTSTEHLDATAGRLTLLEAVDPRLASSLSVGKHKNPVSGSRAGRRFGARRRRARRLHRFLPLCFRSRQVLGQPQKTVLDQAGHDVTGPNVTAMALGQALILDDVKVDPGRLGSVQLGSRS